MQKSVHEIVIDAAGAADAIRSQIRESINKGAELKLVAHVITPDGEELLKDALAAILEKFGAADLQMTAAVIVKEIATNAVKANLKHLLFKEKWGSDPAAAAAFLPEFRKILKTEGTMPYRAALEKASLKVEIGLKFDAAGMTVSARNGFSVEGAEKERLQAKLEQAQNVGDMRQFFANNKGDAEGAGLGFTLVINALKSAGIDPQSFHFSTEDNATTASVFLPFTKSA